MRNGKVVKVSGPLVVATGLAEANMADVVRVGEQRLIGEVLTMTGDTASIQVYEETSGLGPGLIEMIYDGIQRPLEQIAQRTGSNNLPRGVEVPALDRERQWNFTAAVAPGAQVRGGDILGTVQETPSLQHRIMVPVGLSGTIQSIRSGTYRVTDPIALLKTEQGEEKPLTMLQRWPVRRGRPYAQKFAPVTPLQSGQRVIDTLFPGQGGHRSGARPLWFGENGGAARPGQVVGCGRGGLHWMRGAGQ